MSVDGRTVEAGDVEREIGRVLQGFSEVEAPPGLEGRVLLRVAEAPGPRGVGWVPGLVLAAASLLAGVVWVSVERRGWDRSADVATVQPSRAGEDAAAAGVADGGSKVEPRSVPLHVKERALALRSEAGAALSADEELALEEMRAPSRPEPPRPLTAQEELLVSLAQGRGAEALAKADALSDDVQESDALIAAKEEKRRKAEAQRLMSAVQETLFAGMSAGTEGSANGE